MSFSCRRSLKILNGRRRRITTRRVGTREDGTVKGIDLESAVRHKGNPEDYSPEATPPEFAEAFLAGDGPDFVLDVTINKSEELSCPAPIVHIFIQGAHEIVPLFLKKYMKVVAVAVSGDT